MTDQPEYSVEVECVYDNGCGKPEGECAVTCKAVLDAVANTIGKGGASAHPRVQGRCPACNGSSLFLGTGGHVTCSRLDCPNPTLADDQLHRGRPDTQLHDAIECAIGLNVDCGGTQGVHQVRDAVLAAIEEHLDIGDAEAWCKICRRVWDGRHHRCEGDAEQRLAAVHDTLAAFADRGVIRIGHTNLDIPTAGEVIDAVRAALDQPAAGTATEKP